MKHAWFLLCLFGLCDARATLLTWDSDPATPGAQDGAGIWGDIATNWWDGVANTNWVAANPDAAIFGVSNGAAGTVTVNGTTTVASLLFNPPGSGAYAIAGGTLVLANDATITANASATIGSRLAGAGGGPVKLGGGTLTLTGTNTYAGPLRIQAGTLVFSTITNVGSGGSALGAPVTPSEGVIDLHGGAALQFTGIASHQSDRQIRLAGTGTVWTLANLGSINNAGVVLNGDLVGAATGAAGQRTLNLKANNWGSCPVILGGVIPDASPSNVVAVAAIGGGGTGYNTGAIQIQGASNTFSGPVTMTYGCALTVTKLALMGSPSSLGTGLSNNSLTIGSSGSAYGSSLNYVGTADSTTDRRIVLGGSSTGINNSSPSNAALLFVGTNAWTGASSFGLGGASTATNLITAPLSAVTALFVSSAGAWELRGVNTFTGPTSIGGGALIIGGSGVLGSGSYATSIVVNGRFVYDSSATQTLGGVISGTGSVAKTGAGTLVLSATNAWTGPTTVNGGALLVNGSISTGSVAIASGATLGGRGVVRGAVWQDGILSPGALIGRLTVSNQISCGATAVTRFELGGTNVPADYDQLVCSDLHTLDGTLEVVTTNGYAPATGDRFMLIINTAPGGMIVSSFASNSLPALPPTNAWAVTYAADSVVLSVVAAGASPTPYEQWAQSITNPALRGEREDADGDGYDNLLEYSQGTDATNAIDNAKLALIRTNGQFQVLFNRVNSATDIVYEVEGAYGPTNNATWQGIATNVIGTWGGSTNVNDNNTAAVHRVLVTDLLVETNRSLRLKVTRP